MRRCFDDSRRPRKVHTRVAQARTLLQSADGDFDVASNRIMIWRFAAAPLELRALHVGRYDPEWLVFVPRSICGNDIEEAIVGGARFTRYDAADGGVVYIGKSSTGTASGSVNSLFRPPAVSATAPKRK